MNPTQLCAQVSRVLGWHAFDAGLDGISFLSPRCGEAGQSAIADLARMEPGLRDRVGVELPAAIERAYAPRLSSSPVTLLLVPAAGARREALTGSARLHPQIIPFSGDKLLGLYCRAAA